MSSTPIVEYALAVADLGLRIFPIGVLGKRPAHKGWQDEATTDPNQILMWFRENPNYNYGIRTGLENNLVVIDLDGPGAQSWWASKGITAGAKVTTPTGPDRTHLYFRIDDVEISNSQGTLHAGVDVRGEGGYVVGPGSIRATGTYAGDIRRITDATEDLLAIFPEKQTFDHTAFEGEQVESASASEDRQVAALVMGLRALPTVWAEGAGWHSTVFRSACWLSRMANSTAYAMTQQAAITIMLTHTPVYPGWGEDEILRQWDSAVTTTVGEFADIPTEVIPNLLPFLDVAPLLPKLTTGGSIFTDLLFNDPEVITPGAFWKARQTILIECFRAGLTEEQAASIAWKASVARPLQTDPSGLAQLWDELRKAHALVAEEQGDGFEPPAAADRPALDSAAPNRIDLLTDEEREFVAAQVWWGVRYLNWATTRVSMMNAPYHKMNLYMILSLVFADAGFMPKLKGAVGFNLFGMVLGKTTTGKTEAFDIMMSVIRACFPKGDSPDIGGDATSNSLVEKLIERDGKSSFFNADEAHGLFEEMGVATWRAGLRQKWTALYEGKVPMMLRSSKKDVSGVEATTFFTMHLMGTTEGMMSVLDAEFWTSGFLARFLFSIGLDLETTADSYEEIDQEGDVVKGYEAMPKQWAAEFASAKQRLKARGTLPRPIGMEDDARRRHVQFKRSLGVMFAGHRQEALIKPTLIRFGINVRKVASLIAMTDGRDKITLRDELIALEQAEEWLTNIVRMVDGTTESGFTRFVNEVERFIAGQANREVRIERVYSHFKLEKRRTDDYIAQLVAEGRITKTPTDNQSHVLTIKEAIAA